MRRGAIIFLVCLLAGVEAQAGREYSATPGQEVVANEFIVRLMPGSTAATVIARYLPGAQVQALVHDGFFRVRVPGGLPSGIATRIAADLQVDFVEPNRIRHAVVAPPSDPAYGSSWWFQAMQAVEAWSMLPGQYLTAAIAGTGRVKVAVLDTGADCTHPDFINTGGSSTNSAQGGQLMFSLSQAVVPTAVLNPVCPWQDDHGHGTHVSGIVAAATSNAVGVSGLGYPVQVIEYKVLNSAGSGSDGDIMNAIVAATNAGAQVISMSLGGAGYSPALQTAINYAWQHNTVVVAAAGNDAKNELFFPAGANHAVGVSATDSANNLASFSNFGNAVQLAAPGVGILSTAPTYSTSQGWLNYVSLSGTSMATPFVSALAGLVAMTTPNATAASIVQRMEQTANSNTVGGGWGQNYGFGLINASNAIAGRLRTAINGAINGQIVDTSSNPVSGAQITVNGQTIITDATGLYRFPTVPAGTYPVTVSAAGYVTQALSATVAPGADTSFTVTMGVTYGKFTGTITDQGVGVPGAIVQGLSAALIAGVAVADQNGLYTLWMPGGVYDLRASSIGRITTTVSGFTLVMGGTTSANLTLPRMGTIAGSVRDASLNPLANAQVLVTGNGFSAAAASDNNGNYSLIGVPTGSQYSATATMSGFLPSTQNAIAVSADVTTNVSFSMASTTVGAPTFTPPAGTYSSAQSVTISTTTPGASIRYTTDGSAPTSSVGTLYNNVAIAVSSSLTIKAIAYKSGMTDSPVVPATYTINSGGSTWYNPSWSNRKAITINHAMVSGPANLTNFPMLFSVTDANLQALAQASGNDILFTASDGVTKLNHEIESYSSSNGKLIAWVQIPSLSWTANTVIYIYYGNPAAADQQNKTAVWDSNYAAVWHLPNGTALSANDSTINANNGTIAGATAATGQIGGGMTTGSGKYVLSPTMPSSSTITWSAWVKSSASGNYQMIISAVNANYYELRFDSSNRANLIWNYPGAGNYREVRGSAMTDGNWHYLVATYDGTSLHLYADGSEIGTGAVAGLSTSFTSFEVGGRQGDSSFPFNGSIDEVRYSKVSRSADWIITEYINQNWQSTYVAIGAQESGGGGGQVAAPIFTPPAGTYSSAQSVTLSTTTVGASIRYTTDGSTPTSSVGTLYNNVAIPVSSGLTIKAIAYKSGMTDSLTSSAAYTINSGGGPWYNPSWTNRKAITINRAMVSGFANLTNFPVLISLASDANLQALAQSSGNDILFTASDGVTKLNHEIESYSSSNGKLIAWVQIPSLSWTADTVIYIYYGNPAAADQQNKTAVWDSNYAAVWHLPNGTVLSANDSTSNANHGTIAGATAATGQIGGGMTTGSGKYVLSPAMPTSSSVTWSAWVKSSFSGNYQMIISAVNANQYELRFDSSNRADLIWNYPGAGNYSEVRGSAMTDGNWHYLVATYDGASLHMYADGSQIGTGAVAGLSTSFTSFEVGGRQGDSSFPFNGSIDEVRYSKVSRSADWIITEYINQNWQSTYVAIGAQESGGGGGQVAAPIFTPPAGTYSSAQSVTLSTTTVGASIRYTTDGSTPTSSVGTLYNNVAIPVSSGLTIKAIAYKSGMTDSLTSSAAYTINSGGGPWYNPSWTNRKAITINHAMVSGPANLTNFPMLFSVTDANLQALAQANGNDILFTASDGVTKLNHEIESYSSSNGKLIAWVQIPSLSWTADTVIYIYYGNPAAADQQNKTAVWDSNYAAVWHLPNGTVLSANDSTSNANHGTIAGATAATGQIGGGMTTGSGKYVLSPAMPTSSSVTWSAWVKSSFSGNYQMITSAVNSNYYELRFDSSNRVDLIWNYPGAGNYGEVRGSTAMTDGIWHYLVGTYDGASIRVYADGSQIGSAAAGLSTPFTSFEVGGRQGDSSLPFNGSIDEVRYSKVSRSADWIITEYINQNSPGTFFLEGPQQ